MISADDPGLDRLQTAAITRCRSDQLKPARVVTFTAAADAMRDMLPLDAIEHVPAREFERREGNTGRRVYWTVRWAAERVGAPSHAAERVALRTARLYVLDVEGVKDADAARALGVTDRTLRLDRVRMRTAITVAGTELADAEDLPPVPMPADRIRPGGGGARR